MSATDPRECRDPGNDLLPWYLNGTLEAAERDQVEAHLETCAICRENLAQLSGITQAMAARQENAGKVSRPSPVPAKARHAGPSWAIAASVILLSALGVIAYLRLAPMAPSAPTSQAGETALLDLGSGPARSAGAPIELIIRPQTRRVELSFQPPIDGTNDYAVRLVGPDGSEIQSWGRGPHVLDALGRVRLSIETGRFSRPGDHQLLVRHFSSDGESREYSFPFAVASRPPR